MCSVCKKTIKARYTASTYHCPDKSCNQVCHLIRTYSCIVVREVRQCVLATWEWKCQQHSKLWTQKRQPINQQQMQPAPPIDNLQMTFVEAKQAHECCGRCSAILWSNVFLVQYKSCAKDFYQKCSSGPHSSPCDENWQCPTCRANQVNLQETPSQDPNCLVSRPLPSTAHQKLSIHQRKADGIATKILELPEMLINWSIDLCAVKESKLQKNHKTPIIKGSATICKDRKELNGAGLLLFIKNNLIFEKLLSAEQAGLKIQIIRILYHNVYLPNIDTHVTRFNASMINAIPDSIIVGDLNGYSHLWDPIQPTYSWGNKLEKRTCNLDLHVLNDRWLTRTSCITGNNSSPDLPISGRTWFT